MQRPILSALLVCSALITGCGSDADATPADAGFDYGPGPITERPDDGLDTASDDARGDDATSADASGGEAASADSTTADTSSADSAVDAATKDAGAPDAASASGARIHEVYVDRNLEGDKVEFVEIAAPPGTPLENLWLRVLDKTGAPVFNLRVADAGKAMTAKGYWVVGTSFSASDKPYALSEWGLPNDGGSIQLNRLDGAVTTLVDVVGYGAVPTTTSVSAPTRLVEGTGATLPASGSTGKTIGRTSMPGDTDDNAKDFCVMTATPGAANVACL
jgi:hypothetical protein